MAQPPETTFRIGPCSATIWLNQSEGRSFRSVSLERSFRDKQGAWQTSNSFPLADLPAAITLIQMALEKVAGEEAVVSGPVDG